MAQSKAVTSYLVAFNLVSFFGWSMVLTTLVSHLLLGPRTRQSLPIDFSERLMYHLRSAAPRSITLHSFGFLKYVPKPLVAVLDRASSLHAHAGALVAVVQTLAVMEIVHAIAGLVKTPVPTTVIQVFSRLWLVWAIAERHVQQAASPWYASMVFAWSVTECIRYPFYANALMGADSPLLLWARYTFFYVLYPLGAGSEAMLMFRTLPHVLPWNKPAAWTPENYFNALLFVLWWPGLYVMYSHMRRQRRRALGGHAADGKSSKLNSSTLRKLAEQRKKGAQAVADGSWATGETKKGK
jgi:very-long-chain (3R)-3-hydroxyacyl-CoA dehydratase